VEIVECGLPAVVTVLKAISEPRVPSFKGKMKAKRAEIPLLLPMWTLGLSNIRKSEPAAE